MVCDQIFTHGINVTRLNNTTMAVVFHAYKTLSHLSWAAIRVVWTGVALAAYDLTAQVGTTKLATDARAASHHTTPTPAACSVDSFQPVVLRVMATSGLGIFPALM